MLWSSGTFFMEHRELSEIRSHRLEQIEASEAQTVITQCPVCRFYLAGLKSQQVTHPVILLAQAYRTFSAIMGRAGMLAKRSDLMSKVSLFIPCAVDVVMVSWVKLLCGC